MPGFPAALNTSRAAFPDWHFHPDVWAIVLLLAGGYAFALHRHRRSGHAGRHRRSGHAGRHRRSGHAGRERTRTGEAPARPGQIVAFAAGVGAVLVASEWPVHDLAEHYLYSAHMVQHLILTLVAAPLLLLGTPAWLAQLILSPRWLLAIVKSVSRPVPNLVQANLILVLSHWPLIVDSTLRHHPLHFVAHAVLIVSALILWMPVASPLPEVPRLAPLAQMVYLFLQTIIPTVPASFLTMGKGLLYPIYGTFPRLWGISAMTDQQVAGLIMKIGAGSFLWAIIITIFFRWYEREERKPRDVLLWDDVERELNRLDRSKPSSPG